MPNPSITHYGLPPPGHCHRVELLLRMLNLEFRQLKGCLQLCS